METSDSSGLFLTVEELSMVFCLMKSSEASCAGGERQLLRRIENALYDQLSIDDMEKLLRAAAGCGA